jgi:LEA14-like dessication related protein
MNRYQLKWVLGAVMIGTLAFAVDYLGKQVRKMVNLSFGLAGGRIDSISLKEVRMTIFFYIKNPSDIGVSVKDQAYDVLLNGEYIKTVGNENKVYIAPHSDTRIPILVNFTPKEAAKVVGSNWSSLTSKEGRKKIMVDVKGTMAISTDLFTVRRIPFEFRDDLQSIMEY